jgi:hypothetical protein
MGLSYDLQKKLRMRYAVYSMIEMKFKGLDLMFKTDSNGNPVTLFIGKKTADSTIKGERYSRTLIIDVHGATIKDHWDLKGRS